MKIKKIPENSSLFKSTMPKTRGIKHRFENKKGDVFGLSFGMIFSIILIVFFVAAAFVAIRSFLGYQRQAQIGMFIQGLQNKIDEAWNSQSASLVFNSTLPTGIASVCFVNLTAPALNANTNEKNILQYIKTNEYRDLSKNFYIYGPSTNYGINWAAIRHIDISGRNPTCIKVINNVVSIKIERKFDSSLVFVGA